ncbi:hypothetical protein L1987_64952 [Smallanthus sonchifolius]|uniref:Uncharacterized protein n=1 Tax=Smallanthus sonchifolius TaxID=185202 RepID=A0ACB9BT46_9ASTR|nr:hypothetical protein L1987_64952 [Smallanthus sonchifolius]
MEKQEYSFSFTVQGRKIIYPSEDEKTENSKYNGDGRHRRRKKLQFPELRVIFQPKRAQTHEELAHKEIKKKPWSSNCEINGKKFNILEFSSLKREISNL